MDIIRRRLGLALVVAGVVGLAALPAGAQRGGAYELGWSEIGGGGAMGTTGGPYALGGTIGQPDANVLTGGAYVLAGGFWRGGGLKPATLGGAIYLPALALQRGGG
jgi:hypothetical protein